MEAHALWADIYDDTPNPLLPLEERTVDPLVPVLEGALAIDIACGTGRWLRRLVERGATSAVGLDMSPEMLGRAAGKSGIRGRLVRTDCSALPVRSASAGFAICAFGLGYITGLEGFARELSRIVTDRGHLVLTDLHPSAERRGWKRRFRHAGSVIEVPSHVRPVDLIVAVFRSEGFELLNLLEPSFGEPERPIFEQAGKSRLFDDSYGHAAIFACHLRRSPRTSSA